MRRLGDMWSQLTGEEKEVSALCAMSAALMVVVQVYNVKGRENKAAYRIQMKEYHDMRGLPVGAHNAPNSPNASFPDASGAGHKLVCSVCGKGFKTDGGYKYHVANVCIIDMEDAGHAGHTGHAPKWPRAAENNDLQIQEERVTLE